MIYQNPDITSTRTISPLDGEPYTTESRDEFGRKIFIVDIRELTPQRVELAQWITGVLIIIFTFAGFALISIFAFFVPCFYGVVFDRVAKHLKLHTQVVFTPSELMVRTRKGWLCYDRTIQHSFSLIEHDEARAERERGQIKVAKAQMQQRIIIPPRIYGDSFHVVYEHFGHRRDIAAVYDPNRAKSVAARLRACNQIMDTELKMGDAFALKPSDQWDDQPGDLPRAGDLL